MPSIFNSRDQSCYQFHRDSIIGKGGFGIVYIGTIGDGTMVVVKRYQSGTSQGVREFRNEVQLLYQLRHPHLVSLLGFCHEQNEIAHIYEYMSSGSLADYLYLKDYVPLLDESLKIYIQHPLGWKEGLQICICVARGLHYLHTGAKRAVIHRDVKSSNILLDDEWSSKLSDFGLSKLGPLSMSKSSIRIESEVAGTIGYMAPEYIISGELTEKAEVYSFGVVLFEVLSGRSVHDKTSPKGLLGWVSENIRKGTIYHVIGPHLEGTIALDCFKKYLEIACSCVPYSGNERPAMGEVEVTLELALELQEKADCEMEGINPYGECMYDEASFCASVSALGPYRDYFGSGYSSEQDSNSDNNS
ncbi:hypothetical protein CRYUN_Cryun20dG0120200 [Craigia yunnanensis]